MSLSSPTSAAVAADPPAAWEPRATPLLGGRSAVCGEASKTLRSAACGEASKTLPRLYEMQKRCTRNTRMGLGPARGFTANVAQPNPGSRAGAVAPGQSACSASVCPHPRKPCLHCGEPAGTLPDVCGDHGLSISCAECCASPATCSRSQPSACQGQKKPRRFHRPGQVYRSPPRRELHGADPGFRRRPAPKREGPAHGRPLLRLLSCRGTNG
jgi:hypothetical protein